jgi:alpha-glucosidase (family GH31 glycosyl hydrolase)
MTFFDTRDDDSIVIEVLGESITGRILFGQSMLDLITEITAVTGRMHPLPEWTQKGAIVGLEGGTEEIVDISNRLLNNAIPVKLAGVWIQDWVGLRHAFDGDRLSWNWQLDEAYYPRWNELVASLRERGIRTLSYINPFFSNVDDEFLLSGDGSVTKDGATRTTMGKKPRNLFHEGVANKYFVKSPMNHDVPYKFHSGSIEFCMLGMGIVITSSSS